MTNLSRGSLGKESSKTRAPGSWKSGRFPPTGTSSRRIWCARPASGASSAHQPNHPHHLRHPPHNNKKTTKNIYKSNKKKKNHPDHNHASICLRVNSICSEWFRYIHTYVRIIIYNHLITYIYIYIYHPYIEIYSNAIYSQPHQVAAGASLSIPGPPAKIASQILGKKHRRRWKFRGHRPSSGLVAV